MSNAQIVRMVREFQKSRQEWIDILVKNPSHSRACVHIMDINSKIDAYRAMWNWSDESVEYPH